ncbi:MAG: DUF6485 family protein [Patescibacteria group bacterium]
MQCNIQKNLQDCNCTYDCNKKGKCCECVAYHRKRQELPACYFNTQKEKTYDRSISNYFSNT